MTIGVEEATVLIRLAIDEGDNGTNAPTAATEASRIDAAWESFIIIDLVVAILCAIDISTQEVVFIDELEFGIIRLWCECEMRNVFVVELLAQDPNGVIYLLNLYL